jgi:hypothetical protein
MQTYDSQEHFPQAQKVLDWAHLCRIIHLASGRFVPLIPLFSALGASSSMTGYTTTFSKDRLMLVTPNFGFILFIGDPLLISGKPAIFSSENMKRGARDADNSTVAITGGTHEF